MFVLTAKPDLPIEPGVQRRRAALQLAALGLMPLITTVLIACVVYTNGNEAVDFRSSFWTAGWRTLRGASPYAWTHAQIAAGTSFPYPPLTALLLAPFGFASSFTESIPLTILGVMVAPLSLRIVGVRDWRVYGVVALSAPVLSAWQTANFTLAMLLGVALLWRYRDRAWVAGVILALMMAVKPIMAPLWFWLVLTRRWQAAAVSAIAAVAMSALSVAVIGWQQLTAWRHLLALQGRLMDTKSYSLISLATHLGSTRGMGVVLMVTIATVLVAIGVVSSRRRGDSRPFAAMVVITIVASPQVDGHYLALLFVPLALVRPRLSRPWLLPLVLCMCPASDPTLWQMLIWWAVALSLALLPLNIEGSAPDFTSVPWGRATRRTDEVGPSAVEIMRAGWDRTRSRETSIGSGSAG